MPPSPLVGYLGGGLPAQFRVWPDHVVVLSPLFQFDPRLAHRGEQRFVEALVSEPPIDPKGGEANLSTNAFCVTLPGAM
jgi:hypothetical protein